MPLPPHLRPAGQVKGRIVAAPPPPAEVLPASREDKKEEIVAAPTPPAVVAPAPAPSSPPIVRVDDPPMSTMQTEETGMATTEKRCDTCGEVASPAGCAACVRFRRPMLAATPPAGLAVPSQPLSTVAWYAVAIAAGAFVGYQLSKMARAS